MRKIIKKFMIVLILLICIITINAFAGSIETFNEDKEIGEVQNAIDKMGSTAITIIRIASVAIAIVMLLVIGMRYMVSAPVDRADIKKHLIAYVVGAFILFGVNGILTIILKFSEQIKI